MFLYEMPVARAYIQWMLLEMPLGTMVILWGDHLTLFD